MKKIEREGENYNQKWKKHQKIWKIKTECRMHNAIEARFSSVCIIFICFFIHILKAKQWILLQKLYKIKSLPCKWKNIKCVFVEFFSLHYIQSTKYSSENRLKTYIIIYTHLMLAGNDSITQNFEKVILKR